MVVGMGKHKFSYWRDELRSWPIRWDLLLMLAMQMVFLIWPDIDLAVTSLFYRVGEGFFLDQNPLVQFSYHLFAKIHFAVLALLLLALVVQLIRRSSPRKAGFLLLVLVLGPGLLVNGVLKAESGRARPLHTVVYGGEAPFTPAFQHADQCRDNCSFVSGHASMGFFLVALAWVVRDRRWLLAGVFLGGLVGLGRIVQGAHFFSDVIFSFWVVYFVSSLLARWVLGVKTIQAQSQNAA
jgi:lipid A 4'-phosphatase